MATTNFTDATLKGSVTGPTFTGSVDGAKFTGSVTDATTPPVEPPTSGPAGGLITNFTSVPKERFKLDNVDCQVQTAGRDYSLKKVDDYTLRHEIHSGDHAWYDGSNRDRAQFERVARFHNDTVFRVAFRLMIEPGPAQNADWFVLHELHNDDEASGVATSPAYALELAGEKFRVVVRYGNPNSATYREPWTQPSNLKRGQWYVFEFEGRNNKSSGYLKLKLDGTQVLNYTGGVGYGYDVYWCQGPYRATGGPNFAAQFKNLTVG